MACRGELYLDEAADLAEEKQDDVGAPLCRVEGGQVGGVEPHERGGGEVDAVHGAQQLEHDEGALAQQGDKPFVQERRGHAIAS
jgi:hypothetical protein